MAVKLYLSLVATVALSVASCSRGAYPNDVFPEMHYQQYYRSQEPPRLYAPYDSVPVTGKEVAYDFSQAAQLRNPVPRNPQTMDRARELYRVNCASCHGPNARGDGVVAQYFQRANVPTPPDFASQRVRARNEGQLFWVVTNGLGFMPAFGKLMTEQERWTLVHYIESVTGP